MKNDLTWRLEDIAHSLQVEVRGERLYGLDEWSTPIVNLKKAVEVANNLVAQRDDLQQRLEEAESNDCSAAVAAIQFALENSEGMDFLRCWNEGDFDAIREEWPEAPEEVFIGADPLYKPATRGGK